MDIVTEKKELQQLKEKLENGERRFTTEINQLLQYIEKLRLDEQPHTVYLHRNQDNVTYGLRKPFTKNEKNTIRLNNIDGLKRIYDSILNKFKDESNVDEIYAFGEGWLAFTTIDKIALDICSDQPYDHNWLENASLTFQLNQLIQYIEQLKTDKQPHTIFLHTNKNDITYGETMPGKKIEKGIIKLKKKEDLKNIYTAIQNHFKESMNTDKIYTFGEGWLPFITIDKIALDIQNNQEYEQNNFQKYISK